MLTQYRHNEVVLVPAQDTAAPQPRQLPQALRAVLDALAVADAKKLRQQAHQDQRDGAYLGGRPDTDVSIADFAASQTATVFIGIGEIDGVTDTLFVPRTPNRRKNEGRTRVSEHCLLTDLISAAREAAGKSRRANISKPSAKKRRALHQ